MTRYTFGRLQFRIHIHLNLDYGVENPALSGVCCCCCCYIQLYYIMMLLHHKIFDDHLLIRSAPEDRRPAWRPCRAQKRKAFGAGAASETTFGDFVPVDYDVATACLPALL